MLPISRLSRCRATSSVPCLNSEPLKNGSSLKSASTSLASMRIMSARMSLSENTAAKRIVAWPAPRRASAADAASAAPALSAVRRSNAGLHDLPPLVEIAENQIGDHGAAPADIALRAHVALENRAEGVLVGDVEHAERGDRLVDLDRVDVAAEQPSAWPRAITRARRSMIGRLSVRIAFDLLQVAAPRLVLGHHQAHEALVRRGSSCR